MLLTAFDRIEALDLARLRQSTFAILADPSRVALSLLFYTQLAGSKC